LSLSTENKSADRQIVTREIRIFNEFHCQKHEKKHNILLNLDERPLDAERRAPLVIDRNDQNARRDWTRSIPWIYLTNRVPARRYVMGRTQQRIRIAGGYRFPSISANYAHPIIEAQRPRVRAEAGSLFSRTCETRFRYRRRVLFILHPLQPPGNNVIRHCRFHCDSRIARILPGEREFRSYSIALRLAGIPIPPYFSWH